MALPAVATFEECADFSQTVAPFIPQLYELPQQLLKSWKNPDELLELYLATNPLISAVALVLALFPIVWSRGSHQPRRSRRRSRRGAL